MCCFKSLFRKQKDPNPQDLVESFKISFEKENTIDLAVDVSDLVFDKLIDPEVLNSIPVVRLLYGIYKIYKDVHSYRLAKKIYRFLYDIREIGVDEKRKFIEDYIESNQEDGVDALLSVIDQLDNQNKVSIMASMLKAKIEDKNTIVEFNRLVACLQHIPYTDILRLKDYTEDHFEPGVTEILYAAGVLFLSDENFEECTSSYKLNYNGYLLLKYGLKEDVQLPKDYKVKKAFAYGN